MSSFVLTRAKYGTSIRERRPSARLPFFAELKLMRSRVAFPTVGTADRFAIARRTDYDWQELISLRSKSGTATEAESVGLDISRPLLGRGMPPYPLEHICQKRTMN